MDELEYLLIVMVLVFGMYGVYRQYLFKKNKGKRDYHPPFTLKTGGDQA